MSVFWGFPKTEEIGEEQCCIKGKGKCAKSFPWVFALVFDNLKSLCIGRVHSHPRSPAPTPLCLWFSEAGLKGYNIQDAERGFKIALKNLTEPAPNGMKSKESWACILWCSSLFCKEKLVELFSWNFFFLRLLEVFTGDCTPCLLISCADFLYWPGCPGSVAGLSETKTQLLCQTSDSCLLALWLAYLNAEYLSAVLVNLVS